MRVAALLLGLLAVGCGDAAKTETARAPTMLAAAGWTKHEAKEVGLTFELPPGWQIANEVNGKIEVKQDEEALAQAKAQFDDIRMVASASEPDSAAKRLVTTFTILSLKPKAVPKGPDELLKSTLTDLVAEYPTGDPKGTVFELPSGPAVLTSYTDAATRGQSKGGSPEVVDVENIQFRILKKDRIFLLNLTGAKDRTEELQKLAEALLRKVTLS